MVPEPQPAEKCGIARFAQNAAPPPSMPHTAAMDQSEEPTEGNETPSGPVEVPHRLVSPDALRSWVEAFVLREGTDYGAREFTHEEKVQQVLDALESGEVRLLYDPATESVTLLQR